MEAPVATIKPPELKIESFDSINEEDVDNSTSGEETQLNTTKLTTADLPPPHCANKKNKKPIMTLNIPTVDWEELSKDKNRNNTFLSNQRKQLTKDELKRKGRRRKMTPTEEPKTNPLSKQLSSLRLSSLVHEEVLEETEDE